MIRFPLAIVLGQRVGAAAERPRRDVVHQIIRHIPYRVSHPGGRAGTGRRRCRQAAASASRRRSQRGACAAPAAKCAPSRGRAPPDTVGLRTFPATAPPSLRKKIIAKKSKPPCKSRQSRGSLGDDYLFGRFVVRCQVQPQLQHRPGPTCWQGRRAWSVPEVD